MLPAVPKKGALARALDRFSQERKETPAPKLELPPLVEAPVDEVTVHSRCAVTGEYYRTIYRRAPEDGKLVPSHVIHDELAAFAGVLKDTWPARAGFVRADDSPPVQRAVVPMSEFRHMRQGPCPCCKKKMVYSEIRCACGQWVCTGRSYVNEQGTFIHVCHDDCGVHSPLGTSPLKSFEVERAARQQPLAPPAPAQRIAPQRNPALTHTPRPALPPKDKHLLLPGSKKR